MTSLVDIEDIRSRFELGASDTITTRLTEAANAATIHLISLLRTRFDENSIEDIFWVNSIERPFVGDFPQFYLKQGFVKAAPAVSVQYATTRALIDSDPIDIVDFNINYNAGVVSILSYPDAQDIRLRNFTVPDQVFYKISYDAGFATAAQAGPPAYDLFQSVPDWLEEAAKLMVYGIYKGENTSCDKKNAQKVSPYVFSAMQLIERYIRFYPAAYKPMDYGAVA